MEIMTAYNARGQGSLRNNYSYKKTITPNRYSKNKYILGILFLFIILLSQTGCSEYKSFSTGERQLDFSFEYPKEWEIAIVERSNDLVNAYLVAPNTSSKESPVKMGVYVWLHPDPVEPEVWLGQVSKAEQEAKNIISEEISSRDNIHILRDNRIILDECNAYLVEYTHDVVSSYKAPPEKRFNLPTRVLNIAIPRDDKVYELWISASQNEWNKWEKEIQHVLDTFKWK